jgi:hypothetical protein
MANGSFACRLRSILPRQNLKNPCRIWRGKTANLRRSRRRTLASRQFDGKNPRSRGVPPQPPEGGKAKGNPRNPRFFGELFPWGAGAAGGACRLRPPSGARGTAGFLWRFGVWVRRADRRGATAAPLRFGCPLFFPPPFSHLLPQNRLDYDMF